MKQILLITAAILICSCHNHEAMENPDFKAERVSKTATIQVNGSIETVFPLFGAFEERKWADGWHPNLLYPREEVIQEGTTFRTHGHGHHEKSFLWIVSKYQPEQHLIQYLVSTENRYWTITVVCQSLSEKITSAQITYTFTSLNPTGTEINALILGKIYQHNLADWKKAIDYYLSTGKTLVED